MKNNTKAMLLIGGLLVSVASLAPLTTHAADEIVDATGVVNCTGETIVGQDTTKGCKRGTVDVQVAVASTITIDAASESVNIASSANHVKTAPIEVTVTSNMPYTISLKATDADKTALADPNVPDASIPAISGDQNLTVGTNSWGIQKTLSATGSGTLGDTSNATLYTGITGINQVFYKSATGEQSKKVSFPVGITVAPNLPSGEYSTDVTITAAVI